MAKSSGTNISETNLPEGIQDSFVRARCSGTLDFAARSVRARQITRSIEYHYEGAFLREAIIRDEAGERQTYYEHDAFGRIVQERQRTAWRGAKNDQAEFRIEYHYDSAGRRSHTTLIDGSGQKSVVRTHYDGQGRIERLALGGRYYGESDLVRVGAYRTIAGNPMATRFEHGNGRIEDWSAALAALEQEARFPNRGSADPYRPVGKQTEGLASFAAYETPDIDVFDIDRFDQAQPGFDAAGLPQSYTGTNGDWALDWNASGQLVHMKRSVGDEIFFVHDAQGRRVAKQVVTTGETSGQTKTTYFAYDGIQMVGETVAVDAKNIEAQGAIVHRTVYLGYRPVARIDLPGNTGWRTKFSGPEIRAIHTSVSGQALQMTDARQKVLWQETEHLPGGITRISIAGEPVEGWGHQPLRYVGQYHDAETGLSYHGARYYNPHTGRFISPDPAGIADALSGIDAADTLDLYLYAGGDPDRYFDPDGAARMTYYLIDTDPIEGKIYKTGRWAFVIEGIAGDDKSYFHLSGKNERAEIVTRSIYDEMGLYLPVIQLASGLNLVLDTFEVHIDDVAAQKLIAELQQFGQVKQRNYCNVVIQNGVEMPEYHLVLPDISFLANFGRRVVELAESSATLKMQMEELMQKNWSIKLGSSSGGSRTVGGEYNEITIEEGWRTAAIKPISMVAHEVGHAIYDFRPDTSSKETFIAEALSDEGEARLNQIKVQRDILKEKGVDIGLTGHPSNHGEYNNIYDQYFIDDDRDKARRDIGNIMADREIVSGSGGKTYRRHIGDEYDEWDRSRRR